MPPVIYTCPIPSVPTFERSIFTHISAPSGNNIGGYAASTPAFIDAATGITISRRQLRQLALSFGYGLLNHPKLVRLERGDTVLLYSANSLAFPVALYGAVAAGLKCSPANNAYVVQELAHQYTDSRAKIVITNEDGLPVVQEMFNVLRIGALERSKRLVILGSSLSWAETPSDGTCVDFDVDGPLTMDELLVSGSLKEEEKFDNQQAQETCYLCYSSSTTGKPKGVETTHVNLTTVVDIVSQVFPLEHGRDRMLGFLPFFHIYGAVALLLVPFPSAFLLSFKLALTPFFSVRISKNSKLPSPLSFHLC